MQSFMLEEIPVKRTPKSTRNPLSSYFSELRENMLMKSERFNDNDLHNDVLRQLTFEAYKQEEGKKILIIVLASLCYA